MHKNRSVQVLPNTEKSTRPTHNLLTRKSRTDQWSWEQKLWSFLFSRLTVLAMNQLLDSLATAPTINGHSKRYFCFSLENSFLSKNFWTKKQASKKPLQKNFFTNEYKLFLQKLFRSACQSAHRIHNNQRSSFFVK